MNIPSAVITWMMSWLLVMF